MNTRDHPFAHIAKCCLFAGFAFVAGCGGGGGSDSGSAPGSGGMSGGAYTPAPSPAPTPTPTPAPSPTPGMAYATTALVSDDGTAANTDANLKNGWGIAFNPAGFVWVADNGTSKSTLYDGNGVPQSLVVSIPAGQAGAAAPTGIVFNSSQDFAVTQNGVSGASTFIFVGEAGTVSGWSPAVNMNSAVSVFDGGSAGNIYKGVALASSSGANHLYATDFHNGKVDVFDGSFTRVSLAGSFTDPSLPSGYAPYGIQAIGSNIYVSFAKQDTQAEDEVMGAGLGVVDVFDTGGNFIKQLVNGGTLNAPWGMAMAPANFGAFSNDLLVANFGDGKINAFDPDTGAYAGTLSTSDGNPIVIDGLWGIAFGNGINSQPTNTLFYAAGPAAESHGLYGRIDVQ